MVEIRQTPPPPPRVSETMVAEGSRTAAVSAPSAEARPAKDVVVRDAQGTVLGQFQSLLGGRSTRSSVA